MELVYVADLTGVSVTGIVLVGVDGAVLVVVCVVGLLRVVLLVFDTNYRVSSKTVATFVFLNFSAS